MNIMARLGVHLGGLKVVQGTNDIFAKSLAFTDRNGKVMVEFGIVAKAITAQFNLEQEVYYAEINWSMMMKHLQKGPVSFKEISKFPTVSRDLALLIDKSVEFGQIEQIAYASDKKFLKKVELFDVYEGEKLPDGKKSYAVNFVLQDETKTMNDKQTDAVMKKIITNLEKQLGATLR